MKTKLLFTLLFIFISFISEAQPWYTQYFDGADTSASNSIIIQMDTAGTNIWQIGPPQKTIFNSAATLPNALVTDTINNYPVNNVSRFSFTYSEPFWFGILALQWKQKLDMDADSDGAIIEFSIDSGQSWQNVFNNPYVYNFYGFNPANADTLITGEYAFSGTDTSWRDIWLCFDFSFLQQYDTVQFRFTLKSDSINHDREGWVIDNMLMHLTFLHTAKGTQDMKGYLSVYPSITEGIVHIEAEKKMEYHIIEKLEVFNSVGQIVQCFEKCPTKFFVDMRQHPNGLYFLKIKTNFKTETFPVILNK